MTPIVFEDMESVIEAWLTRTRPRFYPPSRDYHPCSLRDCPGVPFVEFESVAGRAALCFPHYEALLERTGVPGSLLKPAS